MKIFMLGLVGLLGLTACGEDERLSRGSAITQIQNIIPGIPYDDADRLIDRICGKFEDGWGGAIITSDFNIPSELQEDFASVILLSARTECPENVRDAEQWQRHNGWD